MAQECVRRRRDSHVRIVLVDHPMTLKTTAVPTKTIQLDSGASFVQGMPFPEFELDPGADPRPANEALGTTELAAEVPAAGAPPESRKPSEYLPELALATSSLLDEWNGASVFPIGRSSG